MSPIPASHSMLPQGSSGKKRKPESELSKSPNTSKATKSPGTTKSSATPCDNLKRLRRNDDSAKALAKIRARKEPGISKRTPVQQEQLIKQRQEENFERRIKQGIHASLFARDNDLKYDYAANGADSVLQSTRASVSESRASTRYSSDEDEDFVKPEREENLEPSPQHHEMLNEDMSASNKSENDKAIAMASTESTSDANAQAKMSGDILSAFSAPSPRPSATGYLANGPPVLDKAPEQHDNVERCEASQHEREAFQEACGELSKQYDTTTRQRDKYTKRYKNSKGKLDAVCKAYDKLREGYLELAEWAEGVEKRNETVKKYVRFLQQRDEYLTGREELLDQRERNLDQRVKFAQHSVDFWRQMGTAEKRKRNDDE